jgi:hypothetical protein
LQKPTVEVRLAEVLVEYTDVVRSADGRLYVARACGTETDGGTWHGWLEFVALDGGETLRSGRETTQPNRMDTEYWATGLGAVYLEGALERALHPITRPAARVPNGNLFQPPTEPAPDFAEPAPTDAVLNPFSVYRKGETLLRRQLTAFSVWHLVNIARAHGLSDQSSAVLNAMSAPELIELIVSGVKSRNGESNRSAGPETLSM